MSCIIRIAVPYRGGLRIYFGCLFRLPAVFTRIKNRAMIPGTSAIHIKGFPYQTQCHFNLPLSLTLFPLRTLVTGVWVIEYQLNPLTS